MFPFKRKLQILSTIGEGLNAYVYKVSKRQESLGISKVFALKVLKRSEDINHFKMEFESLLKATGKHIVKYRGWETYKGKPALLLEYIDGVTLHSLLKTSTLNPSEASWIYQETLEGLHELNKSDLFHGDLSPHNIMIDTSGEIKLIDFGLTHWRTKKIELTPEFAAPSVLNGEQPSLESDIVSLNRIFSQFNLSIASSKPRTKPADLMQKIHHLQNPPIYKTKKLNELENSAPPAKYIFSFKRLFLALTCFSFISPVTAENYTSIEQTTLIRSSHWLAIKTSPSQDWCYTPCKITFDRTGVHTIYWKGRRKSGEVQFYADTTDRIVDFSAVSKNK